MKVGDNVLKNRSLIRHASDTHEKHRAEGVVVSIRRCVETAGSQTTQGRESQRVRVSLKRLNRTVVHTHRTSCGSHHAAPFSPPSCMKTETEGGSGLSLKNTFPHVV